MTNIYSYLLIKRGFTRSFLLTRDILRKLERKQWTLLFSLPMQSSPAYLPPRSLILSLWLLKDESPYWNSWKHKTDPIDLFHSHTLIEMHAKWKILLNFKLSLFCVGYQGLGEQNIPMNSSWKIFINWKINQIQGYKKD